MQKVSLAIPISVAISFSSSACHAVPSLVCSPMTHYTDPGEAIDVTQSDHKATIRKLRIYYVNAHRQWEASARVQDGEVKALIFGANRTRPFANSSIDNKGFGQGLDFAGRPWEFRGFTDP